MEIPPEETQAEGEGRERRSATRFDPLAGVRVMADIQAEGLRAAGELLERVLRSEPDGNGRASSPAGDYTALVDAWGELMRRTVSMFAPGGSGALTVPVDAIGVGPPLRLALDASTAGSGAATEVWLHNGTSSAVGPLVPRCGDLRSAEGKRLKAFKLRFEPRKITRLEARSSRAVKVSLVAKDAPRPGIYRGTIQAKGAPGLWLPVEVTIKPC
jgi:hypothetical protein